MKKEKCLNLGPKMSYFHIFGVVFSKAIFVFRINTLKFAKFHNFGKEENYLSLRKENAFFRYFLARILESYSLVWNQRKLSTYKISQNR